MIPGSAKYFTSARPIGDMRPCRGIAESEFISVPVTVGVLRASILLPAGWREWDDAKLDTVIAHEMSHVIRHDALTQFVSLLHRAVFWFSPLAWWLDRHLRELAEQASDEAALSAGANRNEYAKTLLGFFETLQAAPQRVWWQGVAMAEAGRAEQRVERILSLERSCQYGVKEISCRGNHRIRRSGGISRSIRSPGPVSRGIRSRSPGARASAASGA